MMNLNQRYSLPPRRTLSTREQLDELVRSGYRPYLCGDPGYGVVIAWARSVYKEVDLAGERGFMPERGIPTLGLVPDYEATLQRVSEALGCDSIKLSSIEPSLEYLLSSSIKILVDDFGNLLLKPLVLPLKRSA